MAVLDVGALAEEGVGFVEEEDHAAGFGGVESLTGSAVASSTNSDTTADQASWTNTVK
jgi:hypothetical protein